MTEAQNIKERSDGLIANLSIVCKKIEMSDAMKDSIHVGVASLAKYNLEILAIKAIISIEKKDKKEKASIELTIQMPKHDTVVIKQLDDDLYMAIDTAAQRAQKVLRRYHDKIKGHREEAHLKHDYHHIPMFMLEEEESDEIIPVDLDLHKPMQIEDALIDLKDRGALFFVFNDMDDKKRVIFKRKDGKYGLY